MSEFVDAAWSMMVTVDDFAEVVLSGVPRKASRTDCCCRHHKRSGGPTALDSNQLGLPHGHPARPKQPWWPGPPAGEELHRAEYLALAVPTRVRLTLPHAIWLTSFAILSVSGGEQKGNPRISIHTDRPLQDDQPTPAPSTSSCSLGRLTGTKLLEGASPWQGAAPGSSALGPVREPRPNGRPGRMTVCPSSSTPPMIDHIILHRAPTP